MQAWRCNAESAKFCENIDSQGDYVLFMAARCGALRTPARGIESISGDLNQEYLYFRTVRASDTKIGVLMLMVDDVAFDAMSP